jgi:peptidoglycan/LPS O-acetylase OafA/YrhL
MSTEQPPQPTTVRLCQQCGAEIRHGARYCWLCGSSLNAAQAGRPADPPAGAEVDGRQSQMVLWILVAAGLLGVLHLAATSPDVLRDPAFLSTAIPLALLTLGCVAVSAASARKGGRPWHPGKTAAISALGMIFVIAISFFIALAVIVVSFIAFIITCGATGRLPV